MDTIKEQLGDIFGEACTRCGKNHAIEAPNQNCLQKHIDQLQSELAKLKKWQVKPTEAICLTDLSCRHKKVFRND